MTSNCKSPTNHVLPSQHAAGPQLAQIGFRRAPVGDVVAGVGELELPRGRVEHGVEAGDEPVGRAILLPTLAMLK